MGWMARIARFPARENAGGGNGVARVTGSGYAGMARIAQLHIAHFALAARSVGSAGRVPEGDALTAVRGGGSGTQSTIWDIVPRTAPAGRHVRPRRRATASDMEVTAVGRDRPKAPAPARAVGAAVSTTPRARRLRRRLRRLSHRYGWVAGAVLASVLVGLLIGRM